MYIISIGGIRPKSVWTMWRFYRLTFQSLRQARVHDGCVLAELTRKNGVFFEYSVWTSKKAIVDFARTSPHLDAMQQSHLVLKSFYNKQFTSSEIPKISDAVAKWFADEKAMASLG